MALPTRFDQASAYVTAKLAAQVDSSFITANPVLYFLGFGQAEAMGEFGQPGYGMILGDVDRMGEAKAMQTLGSEFHYFKPQTGEFNDVSTVESGGATPTASGFAEDNFSQIGTAWTLFQSPYKVRKNHFDAAKGADEVGAIMDDASGAAINNLLNKIDVQILNDSMSQADQTKDLWQKMQGVAHTTTANNYYCGVDRSSNTFLNPVDIDAAASADFSSQAIKLELMRYLNVRQGLSFKCQSGIGVNLGITTPELYESLAEQAEGRFQIFQDGIPDKAIGGFKYEVIKYGKGYYTYHPNVAAGTCYFLSLPYWYAEVHPFHNFNSGPLVDKSQTEEGGGYYYWSTVNAQVRLTCHRPDLQARITNLVA